MKLCLRLFLFFLFTGLTNGFWLYAQVPAIKWGPMNDVGSPIYYPYILGEDEEGYYSMYKSPQNQTYKLEKYYRDGRRAFSRDLVLPQLTMVTLEVEKICFVNGRFICFSSGYEPGKKKLRIYVIEYSRSGGVQSKPIKVLFETEVEKKARQGFLSVYNSKDQTKILVNHVAYYKEFKEYRDRYSLYNDSFQLLAEKENSVGQNDVSYRTYNYVVDNDGSFYFAKSYDNGSHYVVSYDARNDYEKWEENIDLSEMDLAAKIHNLRFSINPRHDLLITGLCQKKENLTGCFFMKVDHDTKETVLSKFHVFEESFRKQFAGLHTHVSDTGDAYIPDQFGNLVMHEKEDGGVVIATEYIHQLSTAYQLKDLIVINLGSGGELIWNIRIPKDQYLMFGSSSFSLVYGATRPNYFLCVSYFTKLTPAELFIFYNEHPSNLLVQQDKDLVTTSRLNKAVPVIARVDLATGVFKINPVFDPRSEKKMMQTVFSFESERNGDFLFGVQKGNTHGFGRISLKDMERNP